jgi:hypothetical protein
LSKICKAVRLGWELALVIGKNLVLEIDKIISSLNKVMTLKSGDIISTGTPSGTALSFSSDLKYLKHNDDVEVEIETWENQKQSIVYGLVCMAITKASRSFDLLLHILLTYVRQYTANEFYILFNSSTLMTSAIGGTGKR